MPEQQELELAEFLPLVTRIARQIKLRSGAPVWEEELVNAGLWGVLEARRKFDSAKGRFSTFASWRIRGEMMDWLRAMDDAPRDRRRFGLVPAVVSIDGESGLAESYPDAKAKDPFEAAAQGDAWAAILEGLSARRREILTRRYVDGWTYLRIARHLGVTESAVWQAVDHAQQAIRRRMEGKAAPG